MFLNTIDGFVNFTNNGICNSKNILIITNIVYTIAAEKDIGRQNLLTSAITNIIMNA